VTSHNAFSTCISCIDRVITTQCNSITHTRKRTRARAHTHTQDWSTLKFQKHSSQHIIGDEKHTTSLITMAQRTCKLVSHFLKRNNRCNNGIKGILLSNTLSLCSSVNNRDHVSHPYKTTDTIMVLQILTFTFPASRREDKRLWIKWQQACPIFSLLLRSLHACNFDLLVLFRGIWDLPRFRRTRLLSLCYAFHVTIKKSNRLATP
jgi:hypothetical protein